MQPKTNLRTECPTARTLETVGEWWSMLILRDAFQGFTRFDEFRRSLGIAPNILTRRLNHLTEAGLLERRLYSERPKRFEYLLTEKGRDFFPVIVAITAWGNRHLAPEGPAILMARRGDALPLDPVLVDAESRAPVTLQNVVLVPGPNASPAMRRRLSTLRALRADPVSLSS